MQLFSVSLQDMFSYSVFWVLLFACITIAFLILCIVLYVKDNPREIVNSPKTVKSLKAKYISKIYSLQKKHENKKISDREAYERLSLLSREFAYRLTGIKVTNMSLSEIQSQGLPDLYELIRACYPPEFGPESDHDYFKTASDNAKKVISTWK